MKLKTKQIISDALGTLLIIFILILLTLNVSAQELKVTKHAHTPQQCEMCCCGKKEEKCSHMCHTAPSNDTIVVFDTTNLIIDDESTKDWLEKFLGFINGERQKQAVWNSLACIEMCVHTKEKKQSKQVRKPRGKRHHTRHAALQKHH